MSGSDSDHGDVNRIPDMDLKRAHAILLAMNEDSDMIPEPVPEPVIPPSPPKPKPKGKRVKKPVVGYVELPKGGIIEADQELLDLAIKHGSRYHLVGQPEPKDPDWPFGTVKPKPKPEPKKRVHRKKMIEVEGLPSAATATTEQVISAVSRASGSVPLLCQQCIRAMSYVHRANAAMEGYRNCCDSVIDKLPQGSEARNSCIELRDAAATIARHALADAQYNLRTLACARGCIPNPSIQTHIDPARAIPGSVQPE